MATKSIQCLGWVRSAKEILPIQEPPPSPWQRLRFFPEQVRQRVMLFLNSTFGREVAGLYQALLIGSMVNISPQLVEAFKENGCMHVLSISGLHLSLLGLFAVALLTFLLKRSQWLLLHSHIPTLALVLTAPLLLLYTFIAGMNIPALRSLVTALLVLFAVVLRRQRSLIHLIAAAALIVLAISPLALFTASFQLSFGVVLAINWIYPRLPLVIAKPEPRSTTPLMTKGFQTLQSMIYVSLAATAGTLPLMLYHFNRFSLIGPVMNLIIEPLLCLWALPCGMLGISLLWISPGLATLLCTLGSGGIRLTIWLAEALAGFPYASIWTITPSFGEIALFFVILFLLLHQGRTYRQRSLALVLTLLLLGSFTRDFWYPAKNRELIVSFLDVGQGSSALLQLPNGKNILLDGGGHQTERFDPGQALIAPFLWRKRIWRLDDLLITHPHKDHYNGLPFVYARFQPHRLLINGDNGDEPTYGQFLETVRKKGTPIQVGMAGDKLQEDKELLLECLGMNGLLENMPSWSTNDRSLVFRLQFGAHSFLFPGDIGIRSENRLALQGKPPRTEVLLAPHHGSATSAGENFMAAVSPALVVVSAGAASQGTLPAPVHLADWQQKRILPLVTARHGTATCKTDGKTLHIHTFTGDSYLLDEQGRMTLPKNEASHALF
jgi:competence protein ComEC